MSMRIFLNRKMFCQSNGFVTTTKNITLDNGCTDPWQGVVHILLLKRLPKSSLSHGRLCQVGTVNCSHIGSNKTVIYMTVFVLTFFFIKNYEDDFHDRSIKPCLQIQRPVRGPGRGRQEESPRAAPAPARPGSGG